MCIYKYIYTYPQIYKIFNCIHLFKCTFIQSFIFTQFIILLEKIETENPKTVAKVVKSIKIKYFFGLINKIWKFGK